MLIKVCSLFKLAENKTFSDIEILEATNLIKQEYYFLKWDDLLLFTRQVQLGRYNDIYNRWDLPTFFQMLDRYVAERAETATSINRVKSEELKREPLSPETIKMISDFKRVQDEKRRKSIEISVPEIDESQKLVNGWIEEFKKKVGKINGFLEIDGKMLSCEQFLNYKLEQYNKNN